MEVFRAVVYAKRFTPSKESGKKPGVMLFPVAGKIPHHNVISTEIANSEEFYVGEKYEVTCTEGEPDDVYGRQFRWNNMGKWDKSVLAAINEYGEPTKYVIKDDEFNSFVGSSEG